MEKPRFSVSDFVASMNQTLEYAYPDVEIEGEVASFKVNQGKFVFFDLKDASSSVGCFMTVWQLRQPIEDGMKIIVTASAKLTAWGKFSLTIKTVRLSGEGSLKKSFELLRAKLEKEGLFDPARKRSLPALPKHVAVISSTQAAGYADFMKILDDRFGGMEVSVAHVQVQGQAAPDQMIRAFKYFNEQAELADVIVLIRGGGSADDLSAFNDELLVREIAASRIPVLTGIGHEVDVSLADMAADVRAATPSNAAQLLVPDKREIMQQLRYMVSATVPIIEREIETRQYDITSGLERSLHYIERRHETYQHEVDLAVRLLQQFNPQHVLAQGYSIVRGALTPGATIEIEQVNQYISAEVKHVKDK